MNGKLSVGIVLGAMVAISAYAGPSKSSSSVTKQQGVQAFAVVHEVLTSPRCANCHPVDDVPRVGDDSRPHAMGVVRKSPESGLPCSTCHRPDPIKGPAVPPGAPHWDLPPLNQVFAGRTPAQLCAQLKNPATTGGRDLDALLEHVRSDALVLWGWDPGEGRTPVMVPYAKFVKAFETWVDSKGACPE